MYTISDYIQKKVSQDVTLLHDIFSGTGMSAQKFLCLEDGNSGLIDEMHSQYYL